MLTVLRKQNRTSAEQTNNSHAFFLPHKLSYTKFALTQHMLGFDILLGLFTQHGKLALLFRALSNLSQLCAVNTPTKFLNLPELFLWLWQDLTIAFQVKYCILNRKVRKIVKNKYRYQKRYEWIPPHIRLRTASRFFKNLVLTDQALNFHQRLGSTLVQHISKPQNSNLKVILQQTQSIAVSVLAQTKRKV